MVGIRWELYYIFIAQPQLLLHDPSHLIFRHTISSHIFIPQPYVLNSIEYLTSLELIIDKASKCMILISFSFLFIK